MNSSQLLRDHNYSYKNIFKFSNPNSNQLIDLLPDIDEKQADILNLSMSLYIADKRDIEDITFEAYNKAIWGNNIIKKFQQIYYFLTYGKKININVTTRSNSLKQITQLRFKPIEDIFPINSSVCLFSGGVDSSSAVIALSETGNNVIPINTITNSKNLGLVKKLHFLEPFNKLSFVYIDIRDVSVKSIDNDIGSMRGLIYLTNAFIISQLTNSNKIVFPENGPMMINLQSSLFLIPTRNAHPYFTTIYEDILKTINPNVRVNYIFKDHTKSEVYLIAKKNPLLNQTVSCFSTIPSKNCGLCYACLIRRYSAAAVNFNETKDTYDADILKQQNLKSDRNKDFHSTLLLFIDIIKNKYDIEKNMSIKYIPKKFFKDYNLLLKNFSLDIIIGLYKESMKLKPEELGPLGKFVLEEYSNIDSKILKSREDQLSI